MPPNTVGGVARWSRRRILRSMSGLGVASVLWTLGCAPVLVSPGVAPVLPRPPLPPARLEPASVDPATTQAWPAKIAPTATAQASPTAVPTRPPATPVPPTATPVPSATPTSAPSATPTHPAATPTPDVRVYNPARLVDVIGQARTSYAGLAYGPATNIEVAARRLDGATVAPGETFSFLERIGPQTVAAGFQMGYGIVLQNGQPKTVPMLAGAICDVSTLLFQAVFRAGLPIVERHNHSYWIAHYGDPPSGNVGLEATVDVQPVDFRFRNSTRDWLRIACSAQGGALTVTIHGVNPGWTVTISPPVVTNVVKTDRTVIRQPDASLPPGAEVWIETAEDGFDVSQERRVEAGGKLIELYRLQSHYLPSHNVLSVGATSATAVATGTAVASPTPGPSPTSTSAAPTPDATTTVIPATPTPGPTSTPTPAAAPGAGQIRVPALVGLPVAQAQVLVTKSGLANTYVNYQGARDVPAAALASVPVGAVLSQQPAPGAIVPKGTTVHLAARKE